MDSSLGGISNTVPDRELLQRIQKLERRLATAEADCRRKCEELEEARGQAEQAIQEVRVGKQEIQRLAQNLEHVEMQCELEKHRKWKPLGRSMLNSSSMSVANGKESVKGLMAG